MSPFQTIRLHEQCSAVVSLVCRCVPARREFESQLRLVVIRLQMQTVVRLNLGNNQRVTSLGRIPIVLGHTLVIRLQIQTVVSFQIGNNPRVTSLGRIPIVLGHYPRVTILVRDPIASANGCQIPIAIARGHYPRVTNLGHDPIDSSPWPLLLSRCESTWPLLNRKVDSSSSFGLPY